MLKSKFKILEYILFLIIVILLIFYSNYSSKRNCLKTTKELSFKGIIIKKYIDYKQHEYPILEVLTSNKNVQKINLSMDYSGLFDYVKINDSINKENGNLNVKVHRNSCDSIFVLQINCL